MVCHVDFDWKIFLRLPLVHQLKEIYARVGKRNSVSAYFCITDKSEEY